MTPLIPSLLLLALLLPVSGSSAGAAEAYPCPPTAEDEMGPFYRPGAPVRSAVGQGYLLTGFVRSAVDCRALPHARIELWMAGPDGWYSDAFRATVIADRAGRYRFETVYPGDYARRPPHIHLRVTATAHAPLVTQHYPRHRSSQGEFDLVLLPDRTPDPERRRVLHPGR